MGVRECVVGGFEITCVRVGGWEVVRDVWVGVRECLEWVGVRECVLCVGVVREFALSGWV